MTRDVLWAVRWLRKNPLFTLSVTAILALGIGANTAVFSIVDAALLRPSPFASSGRLVAIEKKNPRTSYTIISPAEYLAWSARGDLYESAAAWSRDFVTLAGGAEPDQIVAIRATANLFSMLGVHARIGRALAAGDETAMNAAILSGRLWRRLFHADPAVVGRAITVSGRSFTIAGVMPPEFEFPDSVVELWLPLHPTPVATGRLQVIARIRRDEPLAAVQSAMTIVARQLEQEDPQKNAGVQLNVNPWRDSVGEKYERSLIFILAAVGLVLLIACADVAGLLLSRAVGRQKEIAIRASLGAGFWRVFRQLLAESFVLAVLGSAAGVAVAYGTLRALLKAVSALPIALPHLQRVSVDGRILLFDMALCLVMALLFSLAPLIIASRTDLQVPLRSGFGAGVPGSSKRVFSVLIACETGFAFLLLVASGLMVRSLIRIQQTDKGFQPDHVLTMRVPIGTLTDPRATGKYATKPQQMAFYRALLDRLERVPGTRAVGVVNNLPLSSVNSVINLLGPGGAELPVSTRTVSPHYFAAMGIPLLSGRTFTNADTTAAPLVAIINDFLARQLFQGRDPIGQPLPEADHKEPVTIVGVVKNSWQLYYDQPMKGEVYLPYQQYIFATFMSSMIARTSGDPRALASTLRKEIWAVDPNQPVIRIATLDDVINESIWRPRFSAWVFSILGGLALLLTAAGVYAVVAYTAGLRAREVGIRVALGASPRAVMALILRDALIPLAAGLAVSMAAALMLTRLLASLLYEVGATDPMTFAGAAAVVVAIGAAASARPAWHAATGDPLLALRSE